MRRLVLLAAVLLVAATAPARAEDELLVSGDGTTWSVAVTQPLFDPTVRWVPGDYRDSGFWVRNTTDQAARVELSFTSQDVNALVADGNLMLKVRTTAAAWQPLLVERAQHVVAATIPGGSTTEVLVRATLATNASNATMTDLAHLDFTARLTSVDAAPIVPPPGEPPTSPAPTDPGSGGVRLPGTGAVIPGWLVVVGLATLGAGIALVGGARVRRG